MRMLNQLDALLGPIAGPKRAVKRRRVEDADGNASEMSRRGPLAPAAREIEPVGAAGPEVVPVKGYTRRRARRWGDAARRASQNEMADGALGVPRSLRAIREAFPLSQAELAQR